MKVSELRKSLKTKNARWTVPSNFVDNDEVENVLGQNYSLGAFPTPVNSPTARLPKFRKALDAPIFTRKPITEKAISRWLAPELRIPVTLAMDGDFLPLDAALLYSNKKGYFFKGDEYKRYTPGEGVDVGYPKKIAANWKKWPAEFNKVDATLLYKNGKAYFFKGDKYIRYTPEKGVDSGYPKKIVGNWKKWPASFNNIDAAIMHPNGKAYFFKGDKYIRYTPDKGVDSGYPKKIIGNWKGWPASFTNIDCALEWTNKKLYFFKNNEYIRFTPGSGVDKGYPKRIAPNWHGLAQSRGIDWRDVDGHNWVNPVRNQGGCGSCVAHAVTAAMEAHYRITTGVADPLLDLSEAFLYFTAERQCNAGDPRWGWNNGSAMEFALDNGICYEENYPYLPVNQEAELIEGRIDTIHMTGYDSTTSKAQMKRWLDEEGPLVTRFNVYQDFSTYWNAGANGVYSHVNGALLGGHAVLVVGYSDERSCWICKNSWGGPGYFEIEYGECGIDSRMYLPQGLHKYINRDRINYNPRNLSYFKRNGTWTLADGSLWLKTFATSEDARNALRVARRHTYMGFVGRDNPRSNRKDYIMEYWGGNSGLPHEPLTKIDAIPYNPNNVLAEDRDNAGWRIVDGNSSMQLAQDMDDALAMLEVIERYSKQCFIGRDNNMPNRKDYIMTYWE